MSPNPINDLAALARLVCNDERIPEDVAAVIQNVIIQARDHIDSERADHAMQQKKYRRVVGTARTLVAWSKTGHGMGLQLQDLERALADIPEPSPPEAFAVTNKRE